MRKLLAGIAVLSIIATPVAVAQSSGDTADSASQSSRTLSVELPDGVSQSDIGDRDVRMIAVQVMLDRSRHSPGVIDGYGGGNTDRAIRSYRKANGLDEGIALDNALFESLLESQTGDVFREYEVTQEDANFEPTDIPSEFSEQADIDQLGYESQLERLAETFHMDAEFLRALNPDVDFASLAAGDTLNIVSHGDERLDADIARIEVRKGDGEVVALDADGNMVASFPATIGSGEFPSPSGSMEVAAIAAAPSYTFDPDDQRWGPDKQFMIAAGPNNPVGGTWIDLGKDGYGIHGSPDPAKVGKRTSHGCVRLTNWDATALARAVTTGIPVEFV